MIRTPALVNLRGPALLAALLWMTACPSSTDVQTPSDGGVVDDTPSDGGVHGAGCVANSAVDCVGPGGCAGVQLCDERGASLSSCECLDAGSAGEGEGGAAPLEPARAQGTVCQTSDDCPGDGFCSLGVCTAACVDDADCGQGGACVAGYCACVSGCEPAPPLTSVDLLFVIDNSNSMREEQASLARSLPAFLSALATGEHDGGNSVPGAPSALPKSLHVGVVSTNMGSNGHDWPRCEDLGDDGILRTRGASDPACMDDYPPYLDLAPQGAGSVGQAATDLGCLARLGTDGCGLEQQLEAGLKALLPAGALVDDGTGRLEPARFSGDTTGHGDGPNAGFLRRDSVLAVVLLTDEDDCSIPDASADLYSLGGPYADEPLNLRCALHSDDGTLHPVARYVSGLQRLRPGRPGALVFAAFAGVPVELEAQVAQGGLSLEALLQDPAMQYRPDGDPNTPEPDGDPTSQYAVPAASCSTPSGLAWPPRRLVKVGSALQARGSRVVVRSLCRPDLGASLQEVASQIMEALGGT